MTLIIGGSGSGKSEYAETRVLEYGNIKRFYIATMQPFDQESFNRIKRHREMRSEKQFQTIECHTNLRQVILGADTVALLECMSNLVANEMFSEKGAKDHTVEVVKQGIEHLMSQSENLVIVTNQIFSDGLPYEEETLEYIRVLGQVNQWIARIADEVIQIVCGIPVVLRKKKER